MKPPKTLKKQSLTSFVVQGYYKLQVKLRFDIMINMPCFSTFKLRTFPNEMRFVRWASHQIVYQTTRRFFSSSSFVCIHLIWNQHWQYTNQISFSCQMISFILMTFVSDFIIFLILLFFFFVPILDCISQGFGWNDTPWRWTL